MPAGIVSRRQFSGEHADRGEGGEVEPSCFDGRPGHFRRDGRAQGDARAEVKRCCLRDRIETPWDAGPVETYYDESRVEQDPQRRAELRDKKSAANSQFSSSALKRASGGRAAGGLSARFAPNIKAEATSEGSGVNRVAGSETVESRMDKLEKFVNELAASFMQMNEAVTKALEAQARNGAERDDRRS